MSVNISKICLSQKHLEFRKGFHCHRLVIISRNRCIWIKAAMRNKIVIKMSSSKNPLLWWKPVIQECRSSKDTVWEIDRNKTKNNGKCMPPLNKFCSNRTSYLCLPLCTLVQWGEWSRLLHGQSHQLEMESQAEKIKHLVNIQLSFFASHFLF